MKTNEFERWVGIHGLASYLAKKAGYSGEVWRKAVHFKRDIMPTRKEALINALVEHRDNMTKLIRRLKSS